MKQTWWNENIDSKFETFLSWIGDKNSQSNIFLRKLLKERYPTLKNCLDAGCGPASNYYGFQDDLMDIDYTGLDSCKQILELNKKNDIKMLEGDVEKIPCADSLYELVFSRHVLEHQSDFKDSLYELIRVGQKVIINIFFIKPKDDGKIINYNPKDNLYHNTYDKKEIESSLHSNHKVLNYEWIDINENENMLLINLIN